MIEAACDEKDLLQKEFDRLKKGIDLKDYAERDKVIKKLMQKGFAYSNIKKLL